MSQDDDSEITCESFRRRRRLMDRILLPLDVLSVIEWLLLIGCAFGVAFWIFDFS